MTYGRTEQPSDVIRYTYEMCRAGRAYVRSGGMALDGNCREGGTFAFSAIRLN